MRIPEIPETPLDWQLLSACRGEDPEIFFPDDKGGRATRAKRVCSGCPVRDECLAYAIRNRERHGVWGGLSERELRAVLRANPAPRLTCLSGKHPKTEANAGSGGRCLDCRRESDAKKRAAERIALTGSASPQSGRRLAA